MNLYWHNWGNSKKLKIMPYNVVTLTKIYPMLRKAANIVITLFFLLTTSGLTIQENFCYGKLVSVFIDKTSEKCCDTPCPGCNIKVISLKVADTFLNASIKISNKEKSVIQCPFLDCANENFIQVTIQQKVHNHLNLFTALKFPLNRAQLQVFLC